MRRATRLQPTRWVWCLASALLSACGNGGGSNDGGAGSATTGGSGAAGAGAGASGGSDAGGAGAAAGATAGVGGSAGGDGGAAGSAGAGGGSAGCSASLTDPEQPVLLSETKCVDMADPSKPAPGLVPYSVRSPLWSDAAEKERFLRIPDGAKIHAVDCATEAERCGEPGTGGDGLDDGHWDLPIGTVLVKNFSIEGKRIETRLLMRRNTRVWKGFSYEWNDAGTEANLLPDTSEAKSKPVGSGSQTWHYPTRSQCLECHTQYAGRSLGPSSRQLNSDYEYEGGSMNQIAKLTELGLFDAPPKALPGYPDPFDSASATLEERARSYLQTNCAICHRPGGEFSTLDLRYGTALADTGLCGKSERDTGSVPENRLVPGNPDDSAVSFRMHDLTDFRMPKLGSTVLDEDGTALIDAWITSLPADACPDEQ